MTLSLLSLLLLAQPATASLPLNPAWAAIHRNPALRRTREVVEIGTIAGRQSDGIHFWMRRTFRDRDQTVVQWTTTLACPGSREVIAGMEQLSAGPDVPGLGWQSESIILDGIGYSLDAPGRIGDGGTRFQVSSNVGTPLATWVDRTLAALQPCWKSEAPGDTKHVAPLPQDPR